MPHTLAALALAVPLLATAASAQTLHGTGCAGASGVTPTLAVSGVVESGATWTLEVTAPGGLGLGYLLIGFSNTSASALGGLPLPLDLAFLFGDPLWSGCSLNVDPSYAIQPFAFDPTQNGGAVAFTFPGFDTGTVHMQAITIDADFVARIAGVSQGVAVRRTALAGMVMVPAGSFQMGSSAASGAPYFGPVGPVHTVDISYPFWIGRYEVTQAEYQLVMGTNPSLNVGPDRPVEGLAWQTARDYCAALTVIETLGGAVPPGYEYRLPTEAEWEYACRAGTTTEYNIGTQLLCADARISGTYHPAPPLTSCGHPPGTVDVGGYAPNAWGLFDMHGNVWEWCLDSFAPYSAAPATDPFVTGGPTRIIRGGSWFNSSIISRSAYRVGTSPADAKGDIGLRVVLAPILVP